MAKGTPAIGSQPNTLISRNRRRNREVTQAMSQEKPSARRKACNACVQAKRRCDLLYPCKRCVEKNLNCEYPNIVVPPFSVNDNQFLASPETFTSPSTNSVDTAAQDGLDWLLPLTTMSTIVSETNQSRLSDVTQQSFSTPPMSDEMQEILDQMSKVTTTLDCERVTFGTRQLRTFPEMLVTKGRTPFLHHHLYHDNIPPVIQDIFGVCALYCSPKTSNYQTTMWRIIDGNVARLFQDPIPSSLPEHLARVQALILFQIIRLFDGDIRQRAQAEQCDTILASWTQELRDRTVWEDYGSQTWEQWIFAESSRRTVITSLTMRGIYLVLKQGHCTLAPQITQLSFTGKASLWNAPSAYLWQKAYTQDDHLKIKAMNFDDLVYQAKGADLEDFGLMMMVTYKGLDFVNEWLETHNYPLLPSMDE